MNKKIFYIFVSVSAVVLCIGIIHAYSYNFVTDDAFVSFRYAKNLVGGLGLVYNAGEKVEGYTNFLWTILIALGIKLNIEPVQFSMTLGIIFYACTLLLYSHLSWKEQCRQDRYYIFIPLTALALSLHRDFNVYATGGLETSMFTFLISTGFILLSGSRKPKSLLCTGIIFVLAMLTRPDGILFVFASVIYLSIMRNGCIKNILYFLLPSFLIFLPYWIWRLEYFGFFFPNTFYAKSIDLPYYSQGLKYTLLYFKTYYGLFLLIPIFLIIMWSKHRKVSQDGWIKLFRSNSAPRNIHIIYLAFLFIITYTLFVIWIGGDFMHARFYIPITPMFFIVIERFINNITIRSWQIILSSFILVTTIYRNDVFGKYLNVGYVVDEVRYYTTAFREKEKSRGETLNKYFIGLPVRVAFSASKLQLTYYADPPYALEASAGLTDTAVAHQHITERGRPGHEKSASLTYLRSKKIHFLFTPTQRVTPDKLSITTIIFDSIPAQMIIYDNKIMPRLSSYPSLRFIRFPEYLDVYIKNMESLPRKIIEEDYSFFQSFYFNHNNDIERQKAIRLFINAQDQAGKGNPI